MIRVQIKGAEQVMENLRKLGERAQPEMNKAMLGAAHRTLAMSQSPAEVPVLTGRLRGSGTVQPLPNGAAVGYGGAAYLYARKQHENDYNHPRGGKAAYLSDPFQQYVNARFVADLDAALRGAVLYG